jgi:hypothetical protein
MALTIAACATVQLLLLQDNVRVVYYDDIAMDSVTDETSCLHSCTTCCCGTEGEHLKQLPAPTAKRCANANALVGALIAHLTLCTPMLYTCMQIYMYICEQQVRS